MPPEVVHFQSKATVSPSTWPSVQHGTFNFLQTRLPAVPVFCPPFSVAPSPLSPVCGGSEHVLGTLLKSKRALFHFASKS